MQEKCMLRWQSYKGERVGHMNEHRHAAREGQYVVGGTSGGDVPCIMLAMTLKFLSPLLTSHVL